ncbi:threonine synthase [Frankia sp. CNm7]|uniref:Threonine synthase n=1 Tax=Frankia nepalensis TaxID=1836974 RepID=A0A937UNR0_9ACTN|nr:threonine synthase [Frankia nepalensis]MBL7494710.1 threonine synthase [Frankia nepalensis]MBL7514131.1 threonine synthase [Frankia nepalensis]MBL7523383.1 threonine synthase [Frankia nepalensis]MBL7626505.1 threonine synthase [Frankia nepalensis]
MTLAPERAAQPGLTSDDANPAIALSCRNCGATYPLAAAHVCVECFAPLEISYDEDRLRRVTRASIEAGPRNLWRYVGLLPAGHDPNRRVSLGAGFTPLRPAPRLAAELGMKTLWVKDDSANPTHSFKDRVVSVALSAARDLGFTTVACASTGNLAHSVAAHAAHAGLRSIVLVPHDLEDGKTVSTAVYGGTLVAIQGNYDDVNRLCSELAGEYEWAFVNVNIRPFYAEGSKTLGYEVAEQLGWRLPEQVVVPIASGSLLTKVDKAFRELGKLGLVEDTPYKVFGAQAAGCNPVAAAFARGVDTVAPVRPSTIAKSLSIGNPADGPYALDVARRTGGAITDVTDDEIVEAMRLLARAEGVFGETAGGVTVACLRRLLREGLLDPEAETVIYNTGDGLKTLDPLVGNAVPTATIPAKLSAFEAAGLGDD